MSTIKFSDGISVNTDGPLRVLKLHDGYYVIGNGMMCPVNDKEEAYEMISKEKEDGKSSS